MVMLRLVVAGETQPVKPKTAVTKVSTRVALNFFRKMDILFTGYADEGQLRFYHSGGLICFCGLK